MSKTRKAYPTYEERIAKADKKIDDLTKLIEDRKALIAKAEELVATRKAALDKEMAALTLAQDKKLKLVALKDRPAKQPKPKMDPEERKAIRIAAITKAREARLAKKEKNDAILKIVEDSGKTVDELLALLHQ